VIHKATDAVSNAGTEFRLYVKVDKAEKQFCNFMSCHQNAGQNIIRVKITNHSKLS
jgi:hypothetical protein